MSVDKAMDNAAFSVEMEGYHIDAQSREWCRQLLSKEITMEQYIDLIQQKAGMCV